MNASAFYHINAGKWCITLPDSYFTEYVYGYSTVRIHFSVQTDTG